MKNFTKHYSYNQLIEQYDVLVMTQEEFAQNKTKLDNPKVVVCVNRAGGPKPPKMPEWFKHWSEEVYQKVPPQWFLKWSEEVYQKVPPQWFETWHEKEFKPLVKRIDNIVKKNNLIE